MRANNGVIEMPAKKKTEEVIEISEIQMSEAQFYVVGTSPLIMHRFSRKAWQELLMPSVRENRASLEQKLKHDPHAEYRGAFYRNRDPKAPALFHLPNGAFHGALAAAALDMPGAKKAQIERLTRVTDINIDLFGVPEIFCAMVRNSDIAHTPDVRTRPIFPRWCCVVTIRFVKNIVTQRTIANLFGAAGAITGIGDWRGQKGGPYGSWKLVGPNDHQFREIKKQGRTVQLKAYEKPAYYDEDTTEILGWFESEVRRREMQDHLSDDTYEPTVTVTKERGRNGGSIASGRENEFQSQE